jgi:predicted AAA+ superfamily ATPase
MRTRIAQNTNLAAEFFVASQLFRLGYNVTITLGHTKEIDIIVANQDGRTVTVDVKGLKNKTNWPVKPKLISRNHFYVLVSYLNRFTDVQTQPEVFVIPSARIKRLLRFWTGNPNVSAVTYKRAAQSGFKNAWHLLFR